MLQLTDVHVYYGHIHALRGVSLKIDDGKIVSLLGANGAGKSTTLKMISRLVQPKSGSYQIDGRTMLRESPSHIVKKRGYSLSGKSQSISYLYGRREFKNWGL